jgi:type IV pilus biogenesis protein CpaD/CtpE
MKKRFFYTAAVLMAAVFLLLVGCTQLERDGFSAIPQNSPASWEYTPYGM